ncbi:MAG TPA: sialidase family protein, partial [Candidatus Thermoplasmatota archaeon]|nr:sialidase family protein [Candidatus Thermoplasmatota archaeon]
RLDCSISNWAEPCLAWASPNDSPSKAEVDIAVNPTDPLNVFVASKDLDPLASPCVWAVAQVTKDGGHTWNTTYVGGTRAERQDPQHPMFAWNCVTDPIMAFDTEGRLYYSLQAYDARSEPGSAIFLATSTDGGETFPEIIQEHVGDGVAIFHDFMRMGTNPATGSVYTLWNQVTRIHSEPVMVASRDGGASAAPPVYFLTPNVVPVLPGGLFESGIVADRDGTVYAAFGGPFSDGHVFLATSTDDGRSFTFPAEVFTFTPMSQPSGASYRVGSIVEVAVDTSGGERDGCLYAAWADGGVQGDPAELLLRSSCDGGATWSEPVTVNGRSPGAQFFPRVAVDGRGALHVVYFTQSYNEDDLLDAEWAVSTDGGTTWDHARLTTVSFDGNLGIHQDGGSFIGDYIGISAVGGDVWMGFPTTFTGRAEVAVAHARLEA